jgi:hypothetical protein
MRPRFLVNARMQTVEPNFLTRARLGGYLYPPDASTEELVRRLSSMRRRFVLADNGAFEHIGRISREAAADTQRGDWGAVISRIRSATGKVDSLEQLNQQLRCQPDAIVGCEDLTLAAWLRAGVPDGELRRRRREIRRRNLEIATRSAALSERLAPLRVLGVASAHDYDSAADAAEVFGRAGVRAMAMGFGAFMADDKWTRAYKLQGRTHPLGRALPERYLRTALVSRGFFDGWSGGVPPQHFHFLGLGAPIMIPLVSVAAQDCAELTFDATSPIKDAVEGTIYTQSPAALKLRCWKVAERMLQQPSYLWDCPCSFCREFLSAHPLELVLAARHRERLGVIQPADLRWGQPLADLLPLLALGASAAERARIGHNHWVLGTLTSSLARSPSPEAFAERQVRRYAVATQGSPYAEAVSVAMTISTRSR